MEVTISGRHLDITDTIRNYATDRANRFSRFFGGVTAVEVVIEKPDARRFEVEWIIHVSGREHLIARGTDMDMYTCIDQASERIERQLHDHKERLRNHKHGDQR